MRPRTASDAEILAAAGRAVSKVGPMHLTLAHVAAEAGVAPATLVQRFGSKRNLLLEFVRLGAQAGREGMSGFRAAYATAVEALLGFGECMAGMAATPHELAHHLAFLIMDLTDPEFHALTLERAHQVQRGLQELIIEAMETGELQMGDAGRLARLYQEALNGALLAWAIYREGGAKDWVRREMEAFLGPYLAGRAKRASRASAGKRKRSRRERSK